MAPTREPATIELNKLTWFLPELRYSLCQAIDSNHNHVSYGIFIARWLASSKQCINSFLGNDCLKAVGDDFCSILTAFSA